MEKAQLDAMGNDMESPDGAPITTLTEVTEKDKLEKAYMKEVSQHSHMSEMSTPMQPPLLNLLQYHGMTSFADAFLQGVAPPVEGVSEATQLYFNKCRAVNGVFSPIAQLITFHKYLDKVKHLHERATSGPSAVSPVM
eukprot:4679435-Ditylum_brightwellii.AAC.1